MNTLIEIHSDTQNTGYLSVWFKHNGETNRRICSEAYVNSLLNMRQKEDFFMGKYKFKISEPEFTSLTNADPLKKLKHSAEN